MSDAPRFSVMSGTTTLAHAILTGTSGWSLASLSDPRNRPFGFAVFSFLLGQGVLGMVRYGHPSPPQVVEDIFKVTSRMTEYVLLPLINLEMYLMEVAPREIGYVHLLSAIVPLITQFFVKKYHQHIIDAFMMANVAGTMYVGLIHENPWAIGLCALSAMNHFVFSRISGKVEVPKSDLVAIGFSFFNIFAVKSINEYVKFSESVVMMHRY